MNARNTARYLAACRDPHVWRRTLTLGLPVGLMQAALNQGDHWWRHEVTNAVVAKTILCPLLSCSIAFASAISTHATHKLDTSTP